MNKRHLLLASIAGVGALAAGMMTATQNSSKTEQKTPLTELWTTSLQTPAGAPLLLSTFKGKPLLINFWATWCAPCIEEMPLLDRFYQGQHQIPPKSFELLGIAVDKSESVVKFLDKSPVSFPIALAGFEGMTLSQQLGNTKGGLPFSILIGKDGAILFKKEGQITTEALKIVQGLL